MPRNNRRLGRRLWEAEYPGSLQFVTPDSWTYEAGISYMLDDQLDRRLRLSGRPLYIFMHQAVRALR